MQWRIIAMIGGGIAALFLLFFLSLCYGEAQISLPTVMEALLHRQDKLEHHLIWDIRMPRTLIGLLSGAALAVAGALLQTVTKNPLAASDTLGINAGAYFMVVLGTVMFPTLLHQSPFLWAAIGGSVSAAAAYGLGGGRKSTPVRLALAGMIVSMVLGSFTGAIHIFYAQETQSLFLWGSGSLVQNDWKGVVYAWPWITGAIVVALLYSRQFDVMNLDEATSASLGQKVGLTRFAGLAISVVLASVIVSVIGPVGFVGLVAPHLVRLTGFRKHRWLIVGSIVWGAVLLTGADVVARIIRSTTGSGELPVGAVMALIGAPWLIWLVLTKMKGIAGSPGQSSMAVGGKANRIPFALLVGGLTVLILTIVFLSLMFGGQSSVSFAELIKALMGSDGAASYTVMKIRLPRTLVAAGAGIALSVSGVLIQSAVRNPLADASILGVTSGAGFGALLVLVAWPEIPVSLLPIAAVVGALLAAVLVFVFAWRKGLNPSVLILLGIAVSAMGAAGIQALIIKGSLYGSTAYIWLTGSTYARSWDQVYTIAVFLVVLVPIALWLARRFDLLVFDDASSTGLGLPVRRTRLLAMTVGVLLAAGAVACVGTIGFLGLMVPHMVRLLTGHHTRKSVILSSLLGATLLVLADGVGRTIVVPRDIPSGLLITLIGGPYFLYLMYRSSARRS
nr:iron ABC transporter permease [Paenibacillus shirakamiensis]